MNNLNEILTDIFRHIDTDSLTYSEFNNYYEYDVKKLSQKYFNQPCSIGFGASRFCIIPENEDFIIKAPLVGESYSYWFDEDDDEATLKHICEDCIVVNESDECIDFIEPYTGCSILGKDCKNYCETELVILDYISSKYENLKPLFCNLEELGTFYGIPVYKQSKVTPIEDTEFACYDISSISTSQYSKEYDSLKKSCNTCEGKYIIDRLNPIWLITVANRFGMRTLRDLLDFIYNNISDLHEGNYGWIGEDPIIFDFAGFHS